MRKILSQKRCFRGSFTLSVLLACILAICTSDTCSAQKKKRKKKLYNPLNVLFIVVDDLRPDLGCYGNDKIATPSIDRLASQGLLFERAYCQSSLSMASRLSFLSGLRPDTTGVVNFKDTLRDKMPDLVTLPQYFQEYGYITASVGKITYDNRGDKASWSEEMFFPEIKSLFWADPENEQLRQELFEEAKADGKERKLWQIKGPVGESAEVPEQRYPDYQIASKALSKLQEFEKEKAPFFLAVGFYKPHHPFVAPSQYWDIYDAEDIEFAKNPFLPKGGIPQPAKYNSWEFREYHDMPKNGKPFTPEHARQMMLGYYACASFIDAQIGRILDMLDTLHLRKKTVVVFVGDQGIHLGEHDIWGTQTLFDVGLRAPLIVSYPKQESKGAKTNALVELVDLYPSLSEICRLEIPEGLDGVSFMPVLEDPECEWKSAVFSQLTRKQSEEVKFMGRSIRTDRYRYTEWEQLDSDKKVKLELYDHESDSDENWNLGKDKAHESTREDLSYQLHEGWESAVPDIGSAIE